MRPSIQLASGRFFDFTSFGVKDIRVMDIAHSLSMLCRFTGHVREFYSVAQHSVLVSRIVPSRLALAGLLHDASEAYINDLSRPMKLIVPSYGEYEHTRLWPVIAAKFDLPDVLPPEVKEADNIALVTERRDLMPDPIEPHGEWDWAADVPTLKETIVPLGWREAKQLFLDRFVELTKEK